MASLEDNPNAEILLEFVTESRETLEKVEPLIIELERGCGPDSETLAVIFRCFHSFKGTASFIDLTHTAALAHSAESLLELYRHGASIQPAHVDLICKTLDTFAAILDLIEVECTDAGKANECGALAEALDQVVAGLKETLEPQEQCELHTRRTAPSAQATNSVVSSGVAAAGAAPHCESARARRVDAPDEQSITPSTEERLFTLFDEPSPSPSGPQLPVDLLVKFVAESEEHLARVEETLVAMESGRVSDEQLAEAFRAMHSFKGNAGICGFAEMERLAHRAETLMSDYREKKRYPDERSTSLMLELLDVLRAALATIPGGDGKIQSLGALLERLDGIGYSQPARQEASLRAANTLAEGVEKDVTSNRAERGNVAKGGGSIRVDTDKLDDLMNLVGELIIAETTVTKNPDLEGHEFENFQKAALNLNRLTRALQDIAMSVRMVPIATTFRKMIRLVRDVSAKQRKRVELVLGGEDTEVDKTVVETIADPLVHLIRNSIDHGIEASEERKAASKDPVGTVWLEAKHQGGEVWITVRDNGRGLDPEKILNKAVERGLADPSRRYTEREIFEFIFAAGFSTAPQITDISGRGVGMDVVRRNIEAVNGRVDVSSELGAGTVFVLRIPLTLAIIEGMLVRVGKSFYTIPLLAIRESVKAHANDITRLSDGSELLKLRRKHYPIVRLSALHKIQSSSASALDGILVIVESGEQLGCVLVDEVVGQRQTVIKPLPEYLKRVRGLAGCSILHNGDISLILDVEGVIGSTETRAA